MSEAFVGEIRMVGFNYAPMGWAYCDGQTLSISMNDALFTLIGTTYGGDGQTTFCLPDLRGRIPIHAGSPYTVAQMGGAERVALTTNQLPAHRHVAQAQSGTGTQETAQNGYWASSSQGQYGAPPAGSAMRSGLVQSAGGGQSHENMMPYLVVHFIICLAGIFPRQS